ncbi:MAG: PIN/TRAM domain-containing protein [Actinomycetota bacterium]
MFVEGVRLFVVVLATAAGFWLGRDLELESDGLAAMVGCLAGYVGGGVLGRLLERAMGAVERKVDDVPPARVVAGALGAIAGASIALVLVLPVALLVPARAAVPVAGLVAWVAGFLGLRVLGNKSVAVLEMLGLSTRPLVRATAFNARDGLLVDTSVIMDGQLLSLARAGIVGSDLMVPRFVLDEVQGFADSPDEHRRRRAQRGLETLQSLRDDGPMRVYVLDDEIPELAEVDAKLVALAKRLQLRLLTNDGPLARVAELQDVPTCNLRKLAQELSPAVVPGDFVRVALTRSGREPGQGVGHLDDGSMVVVNGGEELVGGPDVMLQVTSVVPTSAGRLLFAKLDHA